MNIKKIILIIVVLVVILGSFVLLNHSQNISDKTIIPENTKKVVSEYGIPIDSFQIIKGKIKRNQSLSLLLSEYNVPETCAFEISKKSKGIFDFRKIKTGNKFSIFCLKDSSNIPKYFVYENSSTEFVVIEFSDSINIEKKEKDIFTIRKECTGVITTSLWNTITENKLHPMLAIELSEIYAWNIDFFGLKKGDSFSIIYDEQFVDSTSIGIGNIYCACFNHDGKDYYAFRFEQDDLFCYFDENGNSLRRNFLKAPLRYSRISSGYTGKRFHPILKIWRPHRGVDYAAPSGTPVYAIGDGVVIKKGYTKGAGNYVKIKHNSVYTTGYNHFSRFGRGIRKGKKVKQGQIIGYVGKTGYATGPHLDFRFWKNGKLTNPLRIKSTPVEPVKKENMVAFNRTKDYYLLHLSTIKPFITEEKMDITAYTNNIDQ